jgi:hypothetical protein
MDCDCQLKLNAEDTGTWCQICQSNWKYERQPPQGSDHRTFIGNIQYDKIPMTDNFEFINLLMTTSKRTKMMTTWRLLQVRPSRTFHSIQFNIKITVLTKLFFFSNSLSISGV